MKEQNDIDIAVLKQRVDAHDIILRDVQQIKTDLSLLVQRFANFTPDCGIHQMRMNNIDKELEGLKADLKEVKEKADKVTKKIIYWSGVFAVIVFILVYFLMPIITNRLSTSSTQSMNDSPAVVMTN